MPDMSGDTPPADHDRGPTPINQPHDQFSTPNKDAAEPSAPEKPDFTAEVMSTGLTASTRNEPENINRAESESSDDSMDYSPSALPLADPNDVPATSEAPAPVEPGIDTTMGGTEVSRPETPHKESIQEEATSNLCVSPTAAVDETGQMNTPIQKGNEPIDPEFLEVAKANKGSPDSEWQFSPSDGEDSDEEESPEESSEEEDSDEEDNYSLLNPAEMAKLLMREDGGDEDGNTPAVSAALRTKNEILEEEGEPERPNIILTPDMEIQPIGSVKSIVGKLVLVEASDQGHQRVLDEGSVLALDDRTIIGVVNEVLGRVEMPLYTVRFKSTEEIKELGVIVERKVCSVVQHSEFVFTQPLKAMKGSDASNIYDEEIPATEQEFSDDEAEAEHKKNLKEARQGRGGDRGGGRSGGRSGGRGAKFREPVVTETDEPYVPLARPANLQEMYSSAPPPHPNMHGGKRGGRGRSDRGRGKGSSRGNDNRGGRGGRKGSYPQNDRDRPQLSPPVPAFGQNIQSNQQPQNHQQASTPPLQNQWPAYPTPQQQAEFLRLIQGQTSQWNPEMPQFPLPAPFSMPQLQAFQQQSQQQGSYFASQQTSQPQFQNLPSGAHINPAFWSTQAQAAPSTPTPTQQAPAPGAEDAASRTVRESLEILKNMSK